MVTTQTADNVLKSYYLDIVSEQLNTAANPFLAAIKKTSADVWGKDVRKAVRVGVNGGIGAGTEEGALPVANGNRYVQLVSTLKNLYGTIEISDKAIRASASNDGAFVNLLNDEMDGLVKSSSFNFGRMLFGDGSGMVGEINRSKNGAYGFADVRAIAEGMTVDIYDAKGVLVADKRVITGIDRDEKMVTFSGEAIYFPSIDSDSITPYKVYLQGSEGLEITGLKAIFGTDDIYGQSRKDNPFLKPTTVNLYAPLTEDRLQETMDKVEANSGSKVNFIVCSWDARRSLIKNIAPYKTLETIELEGGHRALSFNGVPIVVDRFCPENTMYLLNTDDFALHQLCDWQWLEGEDGKILKQIPGKPVYTATLVKYAELLCYRPSGQAMIMNILQE